MRLFGIAIAIIAAITILILTFGERGEDENPAVDYGPRSATGILLKADVSLTRRGTHILSINGKSEFYAESKTVNLAALENQTVFIVGDLQPNTRAADLPVLIVESIQPAFTVFAVKKWEMPALNISFDAPSHWQGSVKGMDANFRVGSSDTSILIVNGASGSSLPPGKTFFVGSGQGSRLTSGTAQDVYLQEKKIIIHFHFDAAFQEGVERLEDSALLTQQFERLLKSIAFLSDPKSSSSKAGSGSTMNLVCGGPAGVLCESGYYCEITDAALQAGVCRKR
jgi:hypothetical protein